ncbi:MAG: glycosyltransferase family 39 protein [Pyrinomonadaceae bacterium]
MAKKKKIAAKGPAPVAEAIVEEKVPAKVVDADAVEPVNAALERDNVWLGCSGAIIALAAFLRFFMLGLKPLHHDEGVNGFFLTTLFKDGIYKYDPANYHGPTLYYISVVFAKFFGLETVPVRVSMSIFGVLMVVLVLYLKRYIGKVGTLVAALFVALSPGMVFISRYFIHEIFFVFLSLAIVLSVVLFMEKRRAGPGAIAWMSVLLFTALAPVSLNLAKFIGGDNEGALFAFRIAFFLVNAGFVYYLINKLLTWDEGRPLYLILASASVALFFATKETAFITLGTMAMACLSVWVWKQIKDNEPYKTNWFGIVLAIHGVVMAAALFKRDALADGGKWLSDAFYPVNKPAEPFVLYATIFILIGTVAAWLIFVSDLRRANNTEFGEPVEISWKTFRQALGERTDMIVVSAATIVAFIYVSILFFSSFFTYSEGFFWRAFEAYAIWTKTGNKDHTQSGYVGYIKWGMKIEAPIMVLSVLGSLIAILKGKHKFAMFTAFWAMGLAVAYSIIPYKTPWLALSFLLPMAIAAGYGIGQLFNSRSKNQKYAAIALAVIGSALLAYQTYQQNFVRYDDEDMPYVYAHTRRGLHDLVSEIERYAAKSGKNLDATIEIVSSEYWPLTWYLHNYKANFHGTFVDASTAEMIIAQKTVQDTAMIQKYSTHYKYAGVYPLRPGVNLVLLVRNDLADAKDQEINKVTEYKPIQGYTN